MLHVCPAAQECHNQLLESEAVLQKQSFSKLSQLEFFFHLS
jgi:hypothetical protein